MLEFVLTVCRVLATLAGIWATFTFIRQLTVISRRLRALSKQIVARRSRKRRRKQRRRYAGLRHGAPQRQGGFPQVLPRRSFHSVGPERLPARRAADRRKRCVSFQKVVSMTVVETMPTVLVGDAPVRTFRGTVRAPACLFVK